MPTYHPSLPSCGPKPPEESRAKGRRGRTGLQARHEKEHGSHPPSPRPTERIGRLLSLASDAVRRTMSVRFRLRQWPRERNPRRTPTPAWPTRSDEVVSNAGAENPSPRKRQSPLCDALRVSPRGPLVNGSGIRTSARGATSSDRCPPPPGTANVHGDAEHGRSAEVLGRRRGKQGARETGTVIAWGWGGSHQSGGTQDAVLFARKIGASKTRDELGFGDPRRGAWLIARDGQFARCRAQSRRTRGSRRRGAHAVNNRDAGARLAISDNTTALRAIPFAARDAGS